MDLYKLYQDNKINMEALSKELYFKNKVEDKMDISVIIPVRGRLEFQKPVVDHLLLASDNSAVKISITYVEHSRVSEYLQHTPVSYIWVPCNEDSKFNKCLCFNIGVLYGPKADYYLFYDADLICRYDFFDQIIANLSDAIQTFKGRRVLYANEALTGKIKQGAMFDEFLNDKHPDVTIGVPGAPGGSIFVSRDLFFKIGGYDAEFFHGYSIEDQFFFNKLLCFSNVESLHEVDLIHLNHGSEHAKTPDFHMDILKYWSTISDTEKMDFIKFKSNELKIEN